MTTRTILSLGLLAVLLQFLVPPMRVVGGGAGDEVVRGTVHRPFWWRPDPERITWVQTSAGEKVAFNARAEIDPAGLVIPVGITIAVTALAALLLVPRRRSG